MVRCVSSIVACTGLIEILQGVILDSYAITRVFTIAMRFGICIDANDIELGYLEAIHLFVEIIGE